jgi:hypothetical protein
MQPGFTFPIVCKREKGTLVVPFNENGSDKDAFVVTDAGKMTPSQFERRLGLVGHGWRRTIRDENNEPIGEVLKKHGIATGRGKYTSRDEASFVVSKIFRKHGSDATDHVRDIFLLMVMAKHFHMRDVAIMLGTTEKILRKATKHFGIRWEARHFDFIMQILQHTDDEYVRSFITTSMIRGTPYEDIVNAYTQIRQCEENFINSILA